MRWVLLIVIFLLFSSCLSVVHKNFTMPLNGYVENNSLKKNGYYIHPESEDEFQLFLFYDNGVAFYSHMGLGYLKNIGIDSFVSSRILKNQTWMAEAKIPGAFRINDNKMEINIITHTHYNWHRVTEYQGTILSDTSFMITYEYLPKVLPKRTDTVVYHFVPAAKPDSTKNNWLIHRKWYRGK